MTAANVATARRAEWLGGLIGSLWLLAFWWYAEPRVHPWIDEIFTALTARQGVMGAFSHALTYQSQPPLYYVMAAIAWACDPSVRAVRAVSLLGALVCVWAVIPLARQLRLGAAGGLLAAATAGLPIVQAYAIEARPYTWSMALLVCYVTALLGLMRAEQQKPHAWIWGAVVISATAAMLNFYYTGLVVALGLISAFVGWPGRRRRVVTAGAAMAALMLPWVPTIQRQLGVIAENYHSLPRATDGGSNWSEAGKIVQGGLIGAPIGERSSFVLVILTGLLILSWRTAMQWKPATDEASAHARRIAPDNASLLLLITVGPGSVLVLLGIRFAEALMVLPRYATMTVPLLAAALFALVQRENRKGIRRLYWAGIVLTLASLQLSAGRNRDSRADYRPAAAFLEVQVASTERILIGNFHNTLLFLDVYRGPGHVVPLPVDTNTVRYRIVDDEARDPARVGARIDSTVQSLSGFWWVRVPPPTMGIARTDSILRAHAGAFEVVADTLIAPLQITHFVRRRER